MGRVHRSRWCISREDPGGVFPVVMRGTDHYRTDEWILEMFEGWFDPCPYEPLWGVEDLRTSNPVMINGLERSWGRQTFCNPPYSNPLPWVRKAIDEVNSNLSVDIVVLLLKHDSSTEWYRLLHEHGARFLMVNKRLKHQTGVGCPFPSLMAVLTSSS